MARLNAGWMARAALLLLGAMTLGACGNLQWPPPQGGSSIFSAPRQPPPAPLTLTKRRVTVGQGDTLFTLSKRHNVSSRAIIETNNLAPPYRLVPGQTLRLPAPRAHTVLRGDTLYGISRYYGVDVYELARLNELAPPYKIVVNQSLVLPGGDPRPPSTVESVDELASGQPVSRAPAREKVEIVDESDVAQRSLPPPQGASSDTTGSADAPGEVEIGEPALPPNTRAEPALEPEREVASLTPPSQRFHPSAGTARFIWPVEGKVTAEYGPKGDGLHNDGINIAAPRGAPIYAAASGTVAYAGNELRGFGNLLLIRHSNGWMTAYAHADKLLVKRGDTVEQGQPIAQVGQSGNVVSPQLHFEIRRGKRAVDPLDQLAIPRTS